MTYPSLYGMRCGYSTLLFHYGICYDGILWHFLRNFPQLMCAGRTKSRYPPIISTPRIHSMMPHCANVTSWLLLKKHEDTATPCATGGCLMPWICGMLPTGLSSVSITQHATKM